MAEAGRAIGELTGRPAEAAAPYIGPSAFTHKGGLHASALRIDPDLYQHIDPASVGSRMRTLVSDMGGRSSIELKARELGYEVTAGSEPVARAAARIKELENRGYSFESADASFELLLRAELCDRPQLPPFDVESWQVALDGTRGGAEASVRLRVDGVPLTAKGVGREPVHALDDALHTALTPFFPETARLRLVEHRVTELGGNPGEPAGCPPAVRVFLSFQDGDRSWGTVGVDAHAAGAALRALLDAVHYVLSDGPGRRQDAPRLMAAPVG
jgi:2-isopropylmalate synthase